MSAGRRAMRPTWPSSCAPPAIGRGRDHRGRGSRRPGVPYPVLDVAAAARRRPACPLAGADRVALPAASTPSTRPGCSAAAGIAALVARRPFVMKLTGDPAFERLRARGVVAGDIDAFQQSRGGSLSTRALRRLRDWVRAPRRPRVHAEQLPARPRHLAGAFAPDRVSVMPNPAPAARPVCAARASCGRASASTGETLAFAGRLTAQKSLEVMLAAVAARPGRHPARRGRRGGAGSARRRGRAPRPRRPRAAARAGGS